MNIIKINRHNIRKSDINYLERKLADLQEKYNLQEETIEKILILAK